jgi:hypothetical protein
VVDRQVFTWQVEGRGPVSLVGCSPGETVAELSRIMGGAFRAYCATAPGYGVQVS